MKTIIELLEELSKRPKEEIEYALVALMAKDKLNFINVQQAYVEHLELLKKKNILELAEASSCILESLLYDKILSNNKEAKVSIQRRLYFLNQKRIFKMDSLNKRFEYNEDEAKKYCHIED